jgi:hypothetical protein
MLFYAFDVLYQMYLEEGETPEAYIPREILRNNLYGIDIDSGAAQIAALSVYLKAKEYSPEVDIPQLNVVSADAVLINGNRKNAILDRAKSNLEKDILNQIWQSFDNIREFGSLVQIEDRIDELLNEYREKFETAEQAQFTEDGDLTSRSTFVTEGREESWEGLKDRLMDSVQELAREGLEQNDPVEEVFAEEVGKTVDLIDLLISEYDVVVSNPPYLSSRKMGDGLKEFLKDRFTGYRNLYTSFIERCADMTVQNGYATLVTPQDFMTLYSFRKLRGQMLSNNQIIEGAHLSGFSFSMKDRPFTIPFVLRRANPKEHDHSRFLRLTHEQKKYDAHDKKISGLNNIVTTLRNEGDHDDVYVANQNVFAKIDRHPFVYWFGQEILQTFSSHKQLGDITDAVNGLTSGDDDLFTRNWWEIDEDIGNQYKWFMLSGDNSKYYNSPERVLNWGESGEKIKTHEDSYPRNVDYYGRAGVNFRRSSKRFTARLHPKNHYFGTQAHFIDVSEENQHYYTGYLCSSFVRFILQGLNPGLDFQVGDAKRIPIVEPEEAPDLIKQLGKAAVDTQKKKVQYSEIKREFDPKLFVNQYKNIIEDLEMYEANIELIHGLIDKKVFELFDLSNKAKNKILRENLTNISNYPHITNAGSLSICPDIISKNINCKEISEDKYDTLISSIEDRTGHSVRDVSEELEISPYTVARVRAEEELYDSEQLKTRSGSLLSYILGSLFGRVALSLA